MSGIITRAPTILISKARIQITKITISTLGNWTASGSADVCGGVYLSVIPIAGAFLRRGELEEIICCTFSIN